jgi:hypothetical protein
VAAVGEEERVEPAAFCDLGDLRVVVEVVGDRPGLISREPLPRRIVPPARL